VHERSVSGYVSNDEDKVMEALRLLIIQSHVAKENLGFKNAVKPVEFSSDSVEPPDRNHKGVDAGDVDKRLAGCGNISSSLLSALRLWKGGIVSNGELLELVQKDLQFLKHSAAFGSQDESKLIEDSAFWGRFSFGERWAEKKARLAASSPYGSSPDWDLTGCIVKSNDDLRQEAFIMQLIVLCDEAFRTAGLDLWVNPYTIIATGLTTGIIECVRDAMSFDSLKKRPGYGTDGLVGHFTRMAEIAADPFKALNQSKLNFVRSLAAYSLMSYLFMFKDRHNGNLLLDTAGHVIHIDFGFVFGIAPGGSFSLEQSTPFKLTDEMLEVMGGLGSPLFSEFVTLFCCGFLALQAHADTFLTVVEVTCRGSSFHCFEGKDPDEVVTMLRERFCPELNKSQTVAYALDLIKFATTSYGTTSYDYFQYLSQGIAT
jgi:phosphatidylinositol 4-kinase